MSSIGLKRSQNYSWVALKKCGMIFANWLSDTIILFNIKMSLSNNTKELERIKYVYEKYSSHSSSGQITILEIS